MQAKDRPLTGDSGLVQSDHLHPPNEYTGTDAITRASTHAHKHKRPNPVRKQKRPNTAKQTHRTNVALMSPVGALAGEQEDAVPRGPDIRTCVDRVEQWRKSQDILYRLFVSEDMAELKQCVLGLIATGNEGSEEGLLRRKYTSILQTAFTAQTIRFLNAIEEIIVKGTESTAIDQLRVLCHFILLVALVLETDFLQYILLRTHNRDALRYFVNEVLRRDVARLLMGTLTNGSKEDQILFDINTFVRQSRVYYAIYSAPKPTSSTV